MKEMTEPHIFAIVSGGSYLMLGGSVTGNPTGSVWPMTSRNDITPEGSDNCAAL